MAILSLVLMLTVGLQYCAIGGGAPELREGIEPVLADAVSRGNACSHLVGGIAARHRYLIIAIPAARGLRQSVRKG